MKRSLRIPVVSLFICTVLGAGIATVEADGVQNSATCDQITAILQAGQPGTRSYQRMKDQFNRQCLTIKAGCPSQISLNTQSKQCTDAGMYTVFYIDPSSCKQVRCSAIAPSSSSSSSFQEASSASSANGPCPTGASLTAAALACKNANQKFEYYNINGCRQVRCIENVSSQGSCPSPATLRNKAASCKTQGQDSETYTVGVCKMVRCLNEAIGPNAVVCPTDAQINDAGTRCKVRGLKATVASDSNGCRKVTCVSAAASSASSNPSGCPSDADLDHGIQICKNSGMTGTTMPDDKGCLQVICQPITR